MTLFQHVVADLAITQNAAVKAALAIDPTTLKGNDPGRTPAEAEVSRLCVELIRKVHAIADLVEEHGTLMVFGARTVPLTQAERDAVLAAWRKP